MKVRPFHRIFAVLIAFILIACALFLIAVAWNLVKQSDVDLYVDAFYTVKINSWILTGVACVVLLLSVTLFSIAFGRDKKTSKYLNIGTEETGVIKISDVTFKDMINKNAKAVIGVRDSKTAVSSDDNKVSVIIKAELDEDVVIPQVCAEIQNQVKTNIEAMSGITLEKVNVLVENKPI